MGSQQPQESKLSEAAKADAGMVVELFKPASCGGIVNMALIGESEPNIDIREMK